MMDINEAPVFLLLNPEPNAASNDLPITLYESGEYSTQISTLFASFVASFVFQQPPPLSTNNLKIQQKRMYIYAELHVLDGVPTLTFAKSGYSIQTSEAERIGVDQVVKIQPTGGADASVQCM